MEWLKKQWLQLRVTAPRRCSIQISQASELKTTVHSLKQWYSQWKKNKTKTANKNKITSLTLTSEKLSANLKIIYFGWNVTNKYLRSWLHLFLYNKMIKIVTIQILLYHQGIFKIVLRIIFSPRNIFFLICGLKKYDILPLSKISLAFIDNNKKPGN